MGVGTILKAERILLIAGADKWSILEEALYGKVTAPGSRFRVLQLHRDVTVIAIAGKVERSHFCIERSLYGKD